MLNFEIQQGITEGIKKLFLEKEEIAGASEYIFNSVLESIKTAVNEYAEISEDEDCDVCNNIITSFMEQFNTTKLCPVKHPNFEKVEWGI